MISVTSGAESLKPWTEEERSEMIGPWIEEEKIILKHLDSGAWTEEERSEMIGLGAKRKGLFQNIWIREGGLKRKEVRR